MKPIQLLCYASAISPVLTRTVPHVDNQELDIHQRRFYGVNNRPWVSSPKLQSEIKKKSLEQSASHLQKIADDGQGTRKWGSPGHLKTLEWISNSLEETGYYNVEYQYFNLTETKWDEVEVTFAEEFTPSLTLGVLPGFPNETISGEIISAQKFGCNATDYTSSAHGKIALAGRGGCTYRDLNLAAAKAGAVGLIIFNNDDEPPEDPTNHDYPGNFAESGFIPAVFIDKDTGVKLKERISTKEEKPLAGKMVRRAHPQRGRTANIIAETKFGDPDRVILSGAHSDSVAQGPGINDNGSGLISQLQVALALTKYNIKNKVRFCWWTAEEDGMLGSIYYTTQLSDEEKRRIVLSMDFDMMASPNYVYYVYDSGGEKFGPDHAGAPGSGDIAKTFTEFFHANNLPTIPVPYNDNSDYVGFNMVGIPSGGIATGAGGVKPANETALFGGTTGEPHDKCYHKACDTKNNLNYTAWMVMTRCIADAVARYAMDISRIPFPPKITPVKDAPAEIE